MKTKEINSKKYFKDLKIVVGNSEAKFRKHGEPFASWPDNGDLLIVDYDEEKLSSVKFIRDDYTAKQFTDELEKQQNTFEFDLTNAKASSKRISEHLLFICIENLSLPHNTLEKEAVNNNDKYKLEIITQCDCGLETSSHKHKVNFYFYKYNSSETTRHIQHSETNSTGQTGTGGGWSSPPK